MSEIEVVLPRWGATMDQATLVEWLKDEGERVEADEPICVIETDKVDAEVPSPADGVLVRQLVAPATTVAVGTPIATLRTDG